MFQRTNLSGFETGEEEGFIGNVCNYGCVGDQLLTEDAAISLSLVTNLWEGILVN